MDTLTVYIPVPSCLCEIYSFFKFVSFPKLVTNEYEELDYKNQKDKEFLLTPEFPFKKNNIEFGEHKLQQNHSLWL